jgi:hypothetical protein
MVHPVLLPIRRPLVAVCGHRTDDARLVREVQTAKLAVFFNGIVPLFFEDRASLVMNLARRGKPFGERFDLRSATYPHIHQQT